MLSSPLFSMYSLSPRPTVPAYQGAWHEWTWPCNFLFSPVLSSRPLISAKIPTIKSWWSSYPTFQSVPATSLLILKPWWLLGEYKLKFKILGMPYKAFHSQILATLPLLWKIKCSNPRLPPFSPTQWRSTDPKAEIMCSVHWEAIPNPSNSNQLFTYLFIVHLFIYLIGLRVSCLQNQCSTAWATPPVHFALVIFANVVLQTVCLGWP
jgi:hypothetical protein